MTLLYTSFIFLAASALISLPDSKNPNSPEMADVEHSVPCSDKKKRKKKKKKSKNKGLEDKEIETIQKPQSFTPCTDTSHWPLLLKNYDLLNVRTAHCAPFPPGFAPLKRPLPEFIRFGIINLDKPPHPSSDGVPAWTKRILRVQKTAHSETLDPKVSGNLNESIEENAKSQRDAGIEYVCTARLHSAVLDVAKIARMLEILTGPVFQRPPLISAVKGQLRVRYIYESKLVEYDADKHLVVFRITCEAGTYVSILCVHLGLLLGVGGHMQKLRKARLGIPTLAASTEPVNSEEQDDDSLIASFAASTESVNSEEQDDDSLIASLAASTEPVNLEEQNDDSLIASLAASTESVNSDEQDDSLIASLPASTEPVKWEDMVVEEEEKNKLMAEHGKPNENTPSEWIGNVHLSEVSDSLIPSLAASTKHVSWADMVEEEEEMNKLIAEHGKPNENTPSEWVGNVHLSEVSDFCLAASTEPVSWEDIVEEEEEMNKLIAEHGKPNENTPSENVPHPEVSDSLIASLAASTESMNSEEQDDSLIASLAASTESVSWEDMVLEEEEKNKLMAEHGKPKEKTPSENVPHPEVSDSLIPSLAASTESVSWEDMVLEEEEMNKLIAEHGKPNENTPSENVPHPEVSDSLIPSLAASTKPVSWADMAEEEEEKNKLIAQHGKPNENTPSENVHHSEVSDSLIVCRALLQMNP